jgi:large subunit ribosomal protein L17
MITLGKRGDLHARRRALRVIREREVAAKVFGELADRYRNRPGGYTRVLKTRIRVGDAAPLSIVELVEALPDPSQAGAKRKTAKKKAGKQPAAKKAPAKQAATRKATTKKTATKKAATKKATTKKATAKKAGAKKASKKK